MLVHVHMLRHSTGYALAARGMDTRRLQHYLGHASITNTVRYTAMSPEPFKDIWRSWRASSQARPAAARQAIVAQADTRAQGLAAMIAEIRATGVQSYRVSQHSLMRAASRPPAAAAGPQRKSATSSFAQKKARGISSWAPRSLSA
jgi:hypothetical protein